MKIVATYQNGLPNLSKVLILIDPVVNANGIPGGTHVENENPEGTHVKNEHENPPGTNVTTNTKTREGHTWCKSETEISEGLQQRCDCNESRGEILFGETFVHGGPGPGKSHLIKKLKAFSELYGKSVKRMPISGCSAKLIGTVTCHSAAALR